MDDPRIGVVWKMAGELGFSVLIHPADPSPFWKPYDEHSVYLHVQ
ncbi:MAG: hypothetical protein AAGI52_04380 [Bacteroidota bacterium]